MALIACPDCATQVSDAAPACPKCGLPSSKMKRKESAASAQAAVVIVVAVGIGWWLLSGPPSPTGKPAVAAVAAPAPAPTMYRGVGVGEIGVLHGETSDKNAFIVPERALYDEIWNYAKAKDMASATRLINEKAVNVLAGTHARLIQAPGKFDSDIRVQLTDGPHAGKSGWAWGTFLHHE